MDANDVVLLARAMGIDVPESEAVRTSNYFDVLAQEDANEGEDNEMESSANNSGTQQLVSDLDTAFIADNSTLDNVAADLNDQSMSATPAADDHSHDDVISTFCAITGSNPTDAGHFLEVYYHLNFYLNLLISIINIDIDICWCRHLDGTLKVQFRCT